MRSKKILISISICNGDLFKLQQPVRPQVLRARTRWGRDHAAKKASESLSALGQMLRKPVHKFNCTQLWRWPDDSLDHLDDPHLLFAPQPQPPPTRIIESDTDQKCDRQNIFSVVILPHSEGLLLLVFPSQLGVTLLRNCFCSALQ
jgi:hypothetical protein